jgi:hypothetical protein
MQHHVLLNDLTFKQSAHNCDLSLIDRVFRSMRIDRKGLAVGVVLRWLLVLATIAASTFAAFVLFNLSIWPDRPIAAALWAMGVKVFPRTIIHSLHFLMILGIALVWILPPTSAIAFAARTRQSKALGWGLSISVLLLAAFLWFVAWDVSKPLARWVAVFAALVVIAGLCLSFSNLRVRRIIAIANIAAILLLFIPSAIALTSSASLPPEPERIWTTVLQPQEWWQEAMNTGSEYAATRQVAFANDRVIAVFDAGEAPYQGNQPMSNYRIVSLDARTGITRNKIDFCRSLGSDALNLCHAGRSHRGAERPSSRPQSRPSGCVRFRRRDGRRYGRAGCSAGIAGHL